MSGMLILCMVSYNFKQMISVIVFVMNKMGCELVKKAREHFICLVKILHCVYSAELSVNINEL